MQKQKSKQKGITLIALVVTIIVLIILAGVSLNMLVGDNGIITQAQEAEEKTEEASLEEKIRLLTAETAINQYTGESEEKTAEELQNELNQQGENVLVIQWDKYIIFDLNTNKEIRVLNNGDVDYIGENNIGTVLKNTKSSNSEQKEERNSGKIAIGEDGSLINLDLWKYKKTDIGTFELSDGTNGYISNYEDKDGNKISNIVNGQIKGTVPAYISENLGESWVSVTSMGVTFMDNDELVYAPQIPSTITFMGYTFLRASKLEEAPKEIPKYVTSLEFAFADCTSLTTVPTFSGDKILSLDQAFMNTLIEEVNELPESIKSMSGTFSGCSKLKKVTNLPKELINMKDTFQNCIMLEQIPVIPPKVENMESSFSGCSILESTENDIIIPNTVKNMIYTFARCTNLTGKIQINANPDNYTGCFTRCSVNSSENLILYGTSNLMNELLNTKSSDSKIVLEL